jgi:hypothetical protein
MWTLNERARCVDCLSETIERVQRRRTDVVPSFQAFGKGVSGRRATKKTGRKGIFRADNEQMFKTR